MIRIAATPLISEVSERYSSVSRRLSSDMQKKHHLVKVSGCRRDSSDGYSVELRFQAQRVDFADGDERTRMKGEELGDWGGVKKRLCLSPDRH